MIILFGFNLEISDLSQVYAFLIMNGAFIILVLFRVFFGIFYGLKEAKKAGIINLTISLSFSLLIIIFSSLNIVDLFTSIVIFILSHLSALLLGLSFYLKYVKTISNTIESKYFNFKLAKRASNLNYPLFLSTIVGHLYFTIGILILKEILDALQSYFPKLYEFESTSQIKDIFDFIFPLSSIFIISSLIFLYTICPLILELLYRKYYSVPFINLFKIMVIAGIFYYIKQFL